MALKETALAEQTAQQRLDQKAPYRPSWLDALIKRIDLLPIPAPVFYLGAWLTLFLLYSAVKWIEGVYRPGEFMLFHAVLTGIPIYVLATSHYLKEAAGTTLQNFRPVLNVDDAGYRRLRYEITTAPAGSTLLVSTLGAAYALAAILAIVPRNAWELRMMFTSPVASILDYILILGMWTFMGAGVYQIARQLGLISKIYSRYTRINLFMPGPLYALSALAARAAIAIAIGLYAWLGSNPVSISDNAQSSNQIIFFGVLAVAAVFFPLRGLHSLLVHEKRRLQDENGRQVQAAIAELHRLTDAGQRVEAAGMEGVLNSLKVEHDLIDTLRTWPWETETARLVITATVLPIVLWLIQRLLEKVVF